MEKDKEKFFFNKVRNIKKFNKRNRKRQGRFYLGNVSTVKTYLYDAIYHFKENFRGITFARAHDRQITTCRFCENAAAIEPLR